MPGNQTLHQQTNSLPDMNQHFIKTTHLHGAAQFNSENSSTNRVKKSMVTSTSWVKNAQKKHCVVTEQTILFPIQYSVNTISKLSISPM